MPTIAEYLEQGRSDRLDMINNLSAKGVTVSSDSTFSEMIPRILDISQSGITPTGTINITSNGTVDVTNYASANVNVSGGSGSEIKTGSFSVAEDVDCSVNPYTITHNLGKAPKYFFLWFGSQPISSTTNGINQIDYINDGTNSYHTLSRNQSSSTRVINFTVDTDVEFTNNTVVIKANVLMSRNDSYHWVIA